LRESAQTRYFPPFPSFAAQRPSWQRHEPPQSMVPGSHDWVHIMLHGFALLALMHAEA
jgi:hypothetical protein